LQPERELGRVSGLGRGKTLGFTLIVTDQKLLGIDTRRYSIRQWLSMMLWLALGMILVVSLILSGLEPVLFLISPLLAFLAMLALIFSLPIGMIVLVPRLLRRRLSQTGYSTISAPRKDIISIGAQRPGRTTQKGIFTIRLMNGESLTFWTIGQDMFDRVNSLLTSFSPRQMGPRTREFADLEIDKPNNRLIAIIISALLLTIVISAAFLTSYVSSDFFIELAIGILVTHSIGAIGWLALRRTKLWRRRRNSPFWPFSTLLLPM